MEILVPILVLVGIGAFVAYKKGWINFDFLNDLRG